MFGKRDDIDRMFGTMGLFKNQMNRLFDDFENGRTGFAKSHSRPRVNFYDDGVNMLVFCELPGMNEDEINIKIHNNLLTIKGERKTNVSEGYAILRQERNASPFSRSFTLPVEIDTEQTTATLKNGMLALKLVKARAEKPRKIVVQAA